MLDSLESLLNPQVVQEVLRNIGVRLGQQALQQFRETRKPSEPFSLEEFVRFLAETEEHKEWGLSATVVATDRFSLNVPTCPFGPKAAEWPHICHMDSGFWGEVTGNAFGYAKVCVHRGEGAPPHQCHITVFTKKTPDSQASEGTVFPFNHAAKSGIATSGPTDSLLSTLSTRETEVLRLIGEGLSDKEIATALSLSVRTVEGYAARIREKLGLESRADLIRYALRQKLASL